MWHSSTEILGIVKSFFRFDFPLSVVSFDDNLNESCSACHNFPSAYIGQSWGSSAIKPSPATSRLPKTAARSTYMDESLFGELWAGVLDNGSVSGSSLFAASWAADCGTVRGPIVRHFAGAKTKGPCACALGLCRLL